MAEPTNQPAQIDPVDPAKAAADAVALDEKLNHAPNGLTMGEELRLMGLLRYDVPRLVARLVAAETQLRAERATRKWAYAQLRSWWQGSSRDTSDPAAAIAELDREEAALAVLAAGRQEPAR